MSQPQLLAILCLMRYEDWTFREAKVRLAAHRARRAALSLPHGPDSTMLYRSLRRLDAAVLEQVLSAVVHRLIPQPSPPATVAVEATGLTPGAVGTCFVKRAKHWEPSVTWRHWLRWTMAVDAERRVILAQTARRGPSNDCATLRPLVDLAHQRGPIGVVLADVEFDSERHLQPIRTVLQARRMLPAKRGHAAWRIQGVQAQMRQCVPRDEYGQGSFIDSVISAVKRQRSARAPGHALHTQGLQALLLGLASDTYRL